MHTIESELDVQELHRQVVLETDTAQRAEAIAAIRSLLEEERALPHSAEDRASLQVSEMVLDFLEELPARVKQT
ncbi:MAG: hypothetical protein DMG81_09245 [Acidobacteria bacterium]|nr:MAG: hypothetical protein DMG81_09245 [Acidobacteriota bacterium]